MCDNEQYQLIFPYPIHRLGIEINQKCNLHCSYCWNQKWNNKEIKLEQAQYILFSLYNSIQFWDKKIKPKISFYAAEPLLSPDILLPLLEFPFANTILTNGVLLEGDLAKKIKKYNPHLIISLDGIKENHNFFRSSFDKVVDNIIKYDNYNRISLGMTVNIKSLTTLYQSLEYMFSLPVAHFECHLNLYDNWNDNSFNEYINILTTFIKDYNKKNFLPGYSIFDRFSNLSNAKSYKKDRGGPCHQLDINGNLMITKPHRSCLLMPDKIKYFYGINFIHNGKYISEELKQEYFNFMKKGFSEYNYISDNCEKCKFKDKCNQNRLNPIFLYEKECYPILENFILEELFWK